MPHKADRDEAWFEALAGAILAAEPPGRIAGLDGDRARIEAGIRVYRNNVRSAYSRALADSFPAVRRLVGDEFFKAAANAYFDARRPRERLVARYGDDFPDFLARFAPAARLTYLPDVARLERLWLESYHAAEARPVSGEEALGRAGADPDAARFITHPSLRLYRSDRGGLAVWLHERLEKKEPLELRAGRERALIARPDAEVRVIPVGAGAFTCAAALQGGARLGQALAMAHDAEPDAEPAAVLHALFEAGAISDVKPGGEGAAAAG